MIFVFKKIDGNIDSKSTNIVVLPCKVAARYVRFKPTDYVAGIALKVDVVGCNVTEQKGLFLLVLLI